MGGKSGAEYRICRNMGVCLLVSLFFSFSLLPFLVLVFCVWYSPLTDGRVMGCDKGTFLS